MNHQRGIFEKTPGTGIWWICYFDADGRKRREKAGRKSDAISLYQKRKMEALQGKKLPERLRARKVSFTELAKDALEYSRVHKRSFGDDKIRMAKLTEWLGERPAESVTPQEIERWLSAKSTLKPATLNRYRALLSLVYRLGMQNGKVKLIRARPAPPEEREQWQSAFSVHRGRTCIAKGDAGEVSERPASTRSRSEYWTQA